MGPPLLRPDANGIAAAVAALADGRLVLHPTETVVSLSGDPRREGAVAAARRVKGYDEPRPFLCLVPDAGFARALAAEWPAPAERLAEAFWPGPLTLVVRAGEGAPVPIAHEGRIALRPASDAVSSALLSEWRAPLFSTSANPRGAGPAFHVSEAARRLHGAPGADAIALGLLEAAGSGSAPPAGGVPSTVVDVTVEPPRLVRAGAVSEERLRAIVPDLEST